MNCISDDNGRSYYSTSMTFKFSTVNANNGCGLNNQWVGLILRSFFVSSEGDKLVSTVQKNMSELAVGLLHLQQNIAIPEISLPIHPVIVEAVKKAGDQNRRPVVEDIGNHLNDATFLNALQKQVATWTREIRKVC